MRRDRAPSVALAGFNGFDRFGQRTDLVELDKERVGGGFFDRTADAFRIGHEEIVADDLEAVPGFSDQLFPSVPVVLRQAVFNRDDRILVDPVLPERDHLVAGKHFAFFAQVVAFCFFVVEFGAGGVERDRDVDAGLVSSLLDRFKDHFDGFFVRLQRRGVSAFVADERRVAAALENGFELMIDFRAPAEPFGEGFSAKRHDHEFLEVSRLPAGMRAAVKNIHHRDRERMRPDAADIAVER